MKNKEAWYLPSHFYEPLVKNRPPPSPPSLHHALRRFTSFGTG